MRTHTIAINSRVIGPLAVLHVPFASNRDTNPAAQARQTWPNVPESSTICHVDQGKDLSNNVFFRSPSL